MIKVSADVIAVLCALMLVGVWVAAFLLVLHRGRGNPPAPSAVQLQDRDAA